jgi:SagB-type dehydrogenase family enzyme
MNSYEEMTREKRMTLKSRHVEENQRQSHQYRGISPPPLEKPCPKDSALVDLVKPDEKRHGSIPLIKAIGQRQSRRKFTSDALRLEELSFLLWSTQGVKSIDENKVWTRRVVPSAGSRHPFETYLVVNRVDGLERGVYRYLPVEHKLLLVSKHDRQLSDRISDACDGQAFVGESAVVFVWATIPYRSEWRYGAAAYKGILVDAGHVCQNLYLACEAIGAGTCAVLAYDQKAMDDLIGVDGKDEFTIYLAPVGKVHDSSR